MKKLPFALIFSALWILNTLTAQQSAILEKYIQTGLASNLALKQQQIDIRKNLESIRQAKSMFLPTVQFSATYTRALGGRKLDFPIGDLLNPVYTTLNQLTQSQNFLPLENQQIQFLPDNFHQTGIKFAYPVFNNDLRLNRAVQQQHVRVAEAQKLTLEHELRYQITGAYLQYLQALEAEKIWISTRKVLEELLRFNQSLVKNDVATKEVVAIAEYELSKAEDEIYKLRTAQNSARAYFNFLINRGLQEKVEADSMLLRSAVPDWKREDLIKKARMNRREWATLHAGIGTVETLINFQEKSARLPDAYVGGEAGWQGFGYKFENQAYALAQVGVTFDIFDAHQNRGKVQQAKLDLEKLLARQNELATQIELQVTAAWNEFDAARHRWQTAQSGLVAAEAIFKIINSKYRAEQALLIEWMDAQNRVTTARLQLALAWAEVLEKEAELRRVAGL